MEGGARRAQWQIRLGGEEQDDQGCAQVHFAGEQPQPHRDGHQHHRESGDRLQNEGGQERHAQRAHGGPPVRVRHAADHPRLVPFAAERAQRRQARHHVQEVTAEPCQQLPLPGGVHADQSAEHGNQRQRHEDDQR